MSSVIRFTKFNNNILELRPYFVDGRVHCHVTPIGTVINWLHEHMPERWEWNGATTEPDGSLIFRRADIAPDIIQRSQLLGVLSFTDDGDDIIFRLEWASYDN